MRKKYVLILAFCVLVGLLLHMIFLLLSANHMQDFLEFIITAKPQDVNEISIWESGTGAQKPIMIYTSKEDIGKVLNGLRESNKCFPNHPDYEKILSLDIDMKDKKTIRISVGLGGDVGDTAVYYYGGCIRQSDALWELLRNATPR